MPEQRERSGRLAGTGSPRGGGSSLCSLLLVWHGKLRILHIASSPSSAAVLPALPGLPIGLSVCISSSSSFPWPPLVIWPGQRFGVSPLCRMNDPRSTHREWKRRRRKVAQPAAVCASCAFSLSSLCLPPSRRTANGNCTHVAGQQFC